MKHSRLFLLTVLLLAFGLAGLGQDQKKDKKRKHDGKITREYDRATDQTKFSLEIMPVTCVRDGCIFISLDSLFAGTKPETPLDRFTFAVYVVTKTLEPFADPTLILRLDGQPMDLGAMAFAGKVPADGLTGLPYGIPLTSEELGKLANARKVEIRFATLQFVLGENEVNAINDYYQQAKSLQ